MERKWNASRNHSRTELWKFSMLSYWHITHRNSSLLTSSPVQWDSPVWSRSLKPQFIYSHSLFSRIVLCKWVSSPPICFFIRLLPYRSVLLYQWNPFPGTLVHMDATVMTFIPVLLYSPAVLLLILSFYPYICYACDVKWCLIMLMMIGLSQLVSTFPVGSAAGAFFLLSLFTCSLWWHCYHL